SRPRPSSTVGAAGRSGKAEAASLRCTRTGSQTAPYYRRSRRTRPGPRRGWREGGRPRGTRPACDEPAAGAFGDDLHEATGVSLTSPLGTVAVGRTRHLRAPFKELYNQRWFVEQHRAGRPTRVSASLKARFGVETHTHN